MSRRVLVFTPNWLGDAVMALPAMADVRRALPDATLHLAARHSIAPLAPLVPGVDSTVLLAGRTASIEAVRAGRYDTALLLPNSFNTAWIVHRAGVPERWGYRNEFRSALLTRAVAPPARVHQAAYYQHLTTQLGFPPGPLEPRLVVSDEVRASGAARLEAAGWVNGEPLVAMAPGAAFGGAKRWPPAHYAGTADALAAQSVRVVLIGAGADSRAGAEVLAGVSSSARPINLIGATDLSTLAGVLLHCRALVTNDSGAMHFAAALGVPVTAIFGPTNERETRPLGPGRVSVLHGRTWCRPCMLRECPLTHGCMTGVHAELVIDDVRRCL